MRTQCLGASLLLLALSVLSVSGCGTVKKDKQVNALQSATSGYGKALRWGYFENALGYLHPDQRKPGEEPKIIEGLRLTGYDVVSPPAIIGEGKATQVVQWEYLYEDRQVVKDVIDRQTWSWDPELKSWWLTSGMPDFK